MEDNHNLDIDREAEAHGYETMDKSNFDLVIAKQSIIPNFQSNIDLIISGVENGEVSALDVFAVFKRIEKIFKEAKEKVDSQAFEEAEVYGEKIFKYSGVEFTIRQGSKRLNYAEDEIINELTQKLKERTALVKASTESKEVIFDSEGVEVPKVSVKYDKSSLQVKF